MDFLRLLSDEELKSVIGIIHPSEHYYAKQQADRALEEVKAITFYLFISLMMGSFMIHPSSGLYHSVVLTREDRISQ